MTDEAAGGNGSSAPSTARGASVKADARAFGLVGLCGGLGGAVNAWLCYAKLPIAVVTERSFGWQIIPAGALHGGLLAMFALGVWACLSRQRGLIRWIGPVLGGWVAGWLSFIPIKAYVMFVKPNPVKSIASVWVSLFTSPFGSIHGLWTPLLTFGVAAAVYAWLQMLLKPSRLQAQLLIGITSGVLGSLWWWAQCRPWWFSLLHGAIWGSLVGLGWWKAASRAAQPSIRPSLA